MFVLGKTIRTCRQLQRSRPRGDMPRCYAHGRVWPLRTSSAALIHAWSYGHVHGDQCLRLPRFVWTLKPGVDGDQDVYDSEEMTTDSSIPYSLLIGLESFSLTPRAINRPVRIEFCSYSNISASSTFRHGPFKFALFMSAEGHCSQEPRTCGGAE